MIQSFFPLIKPWSLRVVAVLSAAAALSACQLKSTPVPPNFITADATQFTLQSVDRYADPQSSEDSIVVVKATYKNPESNAEEITPSKFALLDPNLQAVYFGLSGGDIYAPSMADSQLASGKMTEVSLAFRVPASMITARLVYHE